LSYQAKTDWQYNDPVTEMDINRWEQGIKDAHDLLANVSDQTIEQLKDTRLNLLALGIAVQNLQGAILHGITAYFGVETFKTLDKVELIHGQHDPVDQKVYLP
jgi:hypothetical protein